MKKFNGYEETKVFEGGPTLEVGGYICKIVGARVEEYSWGNILKVAFDISDGEFKGFYQNKFDADKKQNADAKWKGVFDVFVPKEDGSDMDEMTKSTFKRFTTSVENSNKGYSWNWEEKTLSGKLFGGIFGREEFKNDKGDYLFAVKCRFANSVDTIKEGKFKIPDDKMTKEHKGQASAASQTGDPNSSLANFQEIPTTDGVPF